MNEIKSVCVYCASSTKVDECYIHDAYKLGELLAQENIRLVYGAGIYGLMGAVSDGVLAKKGKTTGVIPRFMVEKGWNRKDLDETLVVETMQERKQLMSKVGDAAIALPGSVGTLDEFMDALALKKLGLYCKPMVLLNTNHFFDPLIQLLEHMVDEKFMSQEHLKMFSVAQTPEQAIEMLRTQVTWDADRIEIAAI